MDERFDDQQLVNTRQRRKIIPVSDMTWWRWCRQYADDPNFPETITIGGRNFWRLDDLKRLIASRCRSSSETTDVDCPAACEQAGGLKVDAGSDGDAAEHPKAPHPHVTTPSSRLRRRRRGSTSEAA